MFNKRKPEVDDYLPISEDGGLWRYVTNIVQHEQVELSIRADKEHWLHCFDYVAVRRLLFCPAKTVHMVG